MTRLTKCKFCTHKSHEEKEYYALVAEDYYLGAPELIPYVYV